MLANVGFGASVVAMNAYLPTLARESPQVQAKLHDTDEAPLLPSDDQPNRSRTYDEELSRATSRISSFGIALGYAAGITLLVIALFPVTKLRGSTFSLRLSIGLSGVWWALFSIPAALWLPGATGFEQPSQSAWNTRSEIIGSWKRLGGMLHPREIKRLKNTFKYLAAWFLLSDGFTTITSTAILFGKTSLHMKPNALIIVGALTPACGIVGSIVWPMLQRRYLWSNQKILVVLVVMASAIPAYGCLGFLSVFDKLGFGGLTTQGEMFALAVYFGEPGQ